ncbi:hypothetical protein Q5741_00350 [Paenibacillus sp. JX-17]|uniref:DUF1292 domain-containing protein n=1 Tax=Paenibacillus lacisoli TaxID=3064525 RepID=A0ABT9CA07_9BACL|nr:hypothetical protein [Paenibacillus sp. JX-17]MDO7904857.1 hypothetical protein [Paenibacillus sp. JX-17]
MKLTIMNASMKRDDEGAYLGQTIFQAEGYQSTFEITFFSKRGKEWDYSLHFTGDSGVEEEMLAVDALVEENDDVYDELLDAAWNKLPEDV